VGLITVDIDAMRKDLRTMVEEASALGIELPVTSRALECYDQASERASANGTSRRSGALDEALRLRPAIARVRRRPTGRNTPARRLQEIADEGLARHLGGRRPCRLLHSPFLPMLRAITYL